MLNAIKVKNIKHKYKIAIFLMEEISSIFGIKLKFYYKENDFGGYYESQNKKILINLWRAYNQEIILNTFFHEVGHFLQDDLRLFKTNYYPLYKMRKIAYFHEIHADRIGQYLFKIFCKGLKYKKAYQSKSERKELMFHYRDFRYKTNNPQNLSF